MKVSEITVQNIADYLKLNSGDYTTAEINAYLAAAKAFIRSYTGLTDAEIDTHDEFMIVVYVLIQDMYDNRAMYVEKSNLNHVVQTILGMHCVNFIPLEETVVEEA
jgi:hypothetical protein